ncbi:MAG: tRNA-intron lyase [Candidatus Bathyarchaeia archaeon]
MRYTGENMDAPLARAELIGARLIVWDHDKGNLLYRLGFFGKPVGVSKPKPGERFEAPLTLDLMEGIYLKERGLIKVYDPATGGEVGIRQLLKLAEASYKNFSKSYRIYRELRDKGYIVTPGIKFGSDFAVYERGPGIDHAPYIISVRDKEDVMDPSEIVRAGRLATTVRKQFIVAMPGKNLRFFLFRWFKA